LVVDFGNVFSFQVVLETKDGKELRPEFSRGRIFDRDVCQLFLERVKKENIGMVSDVFTKEGRKDRPQALNTVEMMRVASSGLGMSPSNAMSTAEYLYTRAPVELAASESPPNKTWKERVGEEEVCSLSVRGPVPRGGTQPPLVLSEGITKPRGGEDKGDHPPITPMRSDDGSLSGAGFIYCRICFGEEVFTISGKRLLDAGFTSILTWQAIGEDTELPELRRGDFLSLKFHLMETAPEILSLQRADFITSESVTGRESIFRDARIVERATTAPDHLTESELISLMEKHGIGTDASIPVHINTICQRNYVTVESGRRLVPTKLGIALVHGYWKIDPELVLPTMRAEVEAQLNLIAKGQANFFAVKNHALDNFRLKFIYFVENILSVDSLFEDSFTTLADTGKPFSRCGKCRRFMKLIATKPQRLHCPSCQGILMATAKKLNAGLPLRKRANDRFVMLPRTGKLQNGERICGNLLIFQETYSLPSGKDGTLSYLSICSMFRTQGLVKCPRECAGGTGILVLDPQSAPKWRLACNRCPAVVGLFEGASKVRVHEKQCGHCHAQLVIVEYKDKSPLPDGKSTYRGCIFCDETIASLINLNHAYRTEEQRQRQEATNFHRGRGRGRGQSRSLRGSRSAR
uniref:DNA topoisomerase n=1 Tax=Ascaris lumbricoides TaxID=6252 RepID=A0A9J2Q5Q7_ASCLU